LIGGGRHGTSKTGLAKLVLYDLVILWKSGRAAFSRKRDLLLLAAAALIGLLIAIQRAGETAAALGALPLLAKAVIAAAAAFTINLAAARRLTHLRQESVVARHALRPFQAASHALLWNLIPLFGMTMLVIVSTERLVTAAAISLAYTGGFGTAAAQRVLLSLLRSWWSRRRALGRARPRTLPGRTRRDRILRLLVARTGRLGPALAPNLLACAGIGLLSGLSHSWLSSQQEPAAAGAIVGLLVLFACFFLLRTHPPLLRYLLFLGSEPLLPALVAAGLAAAFAAGVLVGMIGSAPASLPAMLAAAATLLLLFTSAALLITLHHATKSRQSAEIAIQIDLVAAGLAGLLFLPLAGLVLTGRLWMLTRHANSLRYMLP
jgi:hypothetical protein